MHNKTSTKHKALTNNRNDNKNQRINNNITTASEQTAAEATGRRGGGLNALNWRSISAFD